MPQFKPLSSMSTPRFADVATFFRLPIVKDLSKLEEFDLSNTLYIGNDLNDFQAIKLCAYSACPSDSHQLIKDTVTFNLERTGGSGVVRELVERILNINILTTLYN